MVLSTRCVVGSFRDETRPVREYGNLHSELHHPYDGRVAQFALSPERVQILGTRYIQFESLCAGCFDPTSIMQPSFVGGSVQAGTDRNMDRLGRGAEHQAFPYSPPLAGPKREAATVICPGDGPLRRFANAS